MDLSKETLKELLKEILQESGVIPDKSTPAKPKVPRKKRVGGPRKTGKKTMEVYVPQDGDVPKEEARIADATKSLRSVRTTRRRNDLIDKKCPLCGSVIKISPNSILNTSKYVCNKCLGGS